MQTCLVAIISLMAVGASHAARILCIIPTPSISHQLPFRPIALELARRGHQVTYITTDPIKKNIQNYTEIDMSHSYEYWRTTFDWTSMSHTDPVDIMQLMTGAGERICEIQLNSPQFKSFLKSEPSFDAIIIERLMFQCYFGLAHKLGSPPLIGFMSLGALPSIYRIHGSPNNPAYSPHLLLAYSDHMSFWQRLYNTYITMRLDYIWYYELMSVQDDLAKKHFGRNTPSVYETDRNFSLLITNNDFHMDYPRPLVPNTIEVTGLHLDKRRQPLPTNIKTFLDSAENGVIYFSLGSNVKGSAMPEHKRRAFLEAFAQLPQRVLWKWEVDSMPGCPENVMISKWLPQQDVLAHPNIRLFITQGGMQSTHEASYNAVPVVGIPFVGDQLHNVAKVVQAGIGYRLQFEEVTRDSVLTAVRTVLEDKSYRENMQRFSAVFREHQETSLDRAVWWIEYVIRHKGAPHLRSAALDLYWWQLLLLDVIAFVLVTAAVVIYVLYRTTKFIIWRLNPPQKMKRS